MKEVFRMNQEGNDDDDPKPSDVEEYGYFDLNTDTEEKEPTLLAYISKSPKVKCTKEEESESQQRRRQDQVIEAASSYREEKRFSASMDSLSITPTPCPLLEMPEEEQSPDPSSHDHIRDQVDNRNLVDSTSVECRID